jgi:hypothetical protein
VRSMKRFVPNWLAVMGAMLPQLICSTQCRGGCTVLAQGNQL